MINETRLEQLFLDLCKIHGEPKDESRVASYLTIFFEDLGYTVERDKAHEKFGGSCGNLYVRIPGTIDGTTIMLSAHMDTVVTGGTVVPVRDGDYIRSEGDTILGADDRSGIAAILETVQVLKETNTTHLPIFVAIMAAEEIGLLGARYCELSSKDADFGVVLDTSGPIGKIVNQAPFHEAYWISVHGKSAHAGIEPEKGINAIVAASRLIANLPTGRISDTATTNIAQIKGGVAHNIVPELVKISGEARSTSLDELMTIMNQIESAVEQANKTESAPIEFSRQREYDGYHLPEDSEVIVRLKQAAIAIGKEPTVTHTGGGADANFFNQKGIPTAVISCGMSKVHTYDEEILVQDLFDCTKMVLALVTGK